MERLVDSYIRARTLKFFLQRSRSNEATIHDLVQKIEGSFNQKEFSLGVFLDIDGAFDNASFGSMDGASGEHVVVLTLRRWIDAMLRCQGSRKSRMLTGISTVHSVVEHGGGWSTL
jgi:hypothetical protein